MIAVGLFWMTIASIQDFRKREVENWWNFSLIVFILAFRAFLSVEESHYWYFLWGIIGFAGGFILANIFYYGRMFAGGDAKLLMALGTILPLSLSWKANLEILIIFLVLMLLVGALYGVVYSIILTLVHVRAFGKEFPKVFEKNRKSILIICILGMTAFILSLIFKIYLFSWLSILLIASPFLLVYAKTIENSCMTRLVKASSLTIGDWLARPLRIKSVIIMPNWEGLSEKELKLIRKKLKSNDKVLVKQGIPFVPVFLIAFLFFLWLVFKEIV